MGVSCNRSNEVDIAELLTRQESAECLDFLRHCDTCDECAEAVRRHSQSGGRPAAPERAGLSPALLGAIGAGAFLLLALVLAGRWLGGGDEAEAPSRPPAATAAPVAGEPPVAEPPAPPPARYSGGVVEELVLIHGESIEIPAEALPKDRSLRVSILLPVASTSDAPRPVRILAPGRDPLDTVGQHVDGDRSNATVEIEPGWLRPGRYIVEVRTTEMSHLPIRRYVLLVR